MGFLVIHSIIIVIIQLISLFLLFTDSMEVKPIMTRKLRRRPNDPVPIPDKRRKPAPDILHIILQSVFFFKDVLGRLPFYFFLKTTYWFPKWKCCFLHLAGGQCEFHVRQCFELCFTSGLKGSLSLVSCFAMMEKKNVSLTLHTSAKLFTNRWTDYGRSKNIE